MRSAGGGPQFNQAVAILFEHDEHKEQASTNLAHAHEPKRLDMTHVKEVAGAGARKAPERSAGSRGEHTQGHLARPGVVEAVAPCTAGAAAELVSPLGHDKIGRRRHRHRGLFACTLRRALLFHSTPPKSIGNKALKL